MALNELAAEINANAVAHGFWEGERNFGEMIALAHSELSEALEEHRAGRASVWYGEPILRADAEEDCMGNYTLPGSFVRKPEGVAVELADCIIRCLDTMQSLGVDIDEVIAQKMDYNTARPYKHVRNY